MKKYFLIMLFSLSSFLSPNVYANGDGHASGAHEEAGHETEHEEGPHGGRLFKKDDISLEVTIFEKAMPPHFRIYIYQNEKPITLKAAELSITLKRFGDIVDDIHFVSIDDFLQSKEIIREPHSFEVSITLKYADKMYQWKYDSFEGRTTLAPEVVAAAGIKTSKATSGILRKELKVFGKISLNRDTMASIYPRYAGVVKKLNKTLGDVVQLGEVLAIVEGNESLQNYAIQSPISGMIVKRQISLGELVKEDHKLYEIADLNTVWADFSLYRKEFPLVKKGMPVVITADDGKHFVEGAITYISPLGIEDSQTVLAGTTISNKTQEWLPGMYINAAITINQKPVTVSVARSALQKWLGREVVFIQRGDEFEATPVTLGEQDDQQVEVLEGVNAGDTYVSENSFFLKAELGKFSASHDD